MLTWQEMRKTNDELSAWHNAPSNLCLDFHGDPKTADLVIFSDGNHLMALDETITRFKRHLSRVADVFYVTTPPGPILALLRHGRLRIGSLILSAFPHVFLGPPLVLDVLVRENHMITHVPFVKNQGNVLLIRKHNPKGISTIHDIERDDITLFMSNPETETGSYQVYQSTLDALAKQEGLGDAFTLKKVQKNQVIFGLAIHHREAPQAVADGRADAAVVFYHLARYFSRIFPDSFEWIPLGGTAEKPEPFPGNIINITHAGVIGDGGNWGHTFIEYLQSSETAEIYENHGLISLTRKKEKHSSPLL